MSQGAQKTRWETRIGLGLLGGLMAVLFYVAWRKVDSLLVETSPGLQAAAPTVSRPWKAAGTVGPTVLPPAVSNERSASPAPLGPNSAAEATSSIPPSMRPRPLAGQFIASPSEAPSVRPLEQPTASATIVGFRGEEQERIMNMEPPADPAPFAKASPPTDFQAVASIVGREPNGESDWNEPVADAVEGKPQADIVTMDRDSFWSIAERVYGDGAWFKALYAHNRNRFPAPDRLVAGEPLDAPPAEELRRLYPTLCPKPKLESTGIARTTLPAVGSPASALSGRTYVVQEGETLAQIAENALGRRSRWTEIYRLNRDRLGEQFDTPPAGLVLVLPETARIADAYEPAANGERR